MNLFIVKLKKYLHSFFSNFKKTKVKAVHDSDLLEVLKSLGVLEKVQENRATCSFCKEIVNLDNLAAVFKDGSEVKFICSKPECVSKV